MIIIGLITSVPMKMVRLTKLAKLVKIEKFARSCEETLSHLNLFLQLPFLQKMGASVCVTSADETYRAAPEPKCY